MQETLLRDSGERMRGLTCATILGNLTFDILGTSIAKQTRGRHARSDASEPDWRSFAPLAGRLLILPCPRMALMDANIARSGCTFLGMERLTLVDQAPVA